MGFRPFLLLYQPLPLLTSVINPPILLRLTTKSHPHRLLHRPRSNDSRKHVLKGFESFGSPNGRSFTIESRRMMNASAVATALRPFYFAVHPDLFGRYPNQRVSKCIDSFILFSRLGVASGCYLLFFF